MQELTDLQEKISALVDSFQAFVNALNNHMDRTEEMGRELEQLKHDRGPQDR